jgi:uncharacterized UPF0160 family protein
MPDSSDNHKEVVYNRLYEYFMEEIDAVDNGINATEEKPKYHVTTTLGGRVRNLNPAWNDANPVSITDIAQCTSFLRLR